MGFFIRKPIRFGPIRLNLSNWGVGLSAGVKGARVGIRPNGQTYVYGGRHGLYYRQNLTSSTGPNVFAIVLTLCSAVLLAFVALPLMFVLMFVAVFVGIVVKATR
jgi:hypothetical protein